MFRNQGGIGRSELGYAVSLFAVSMTLLVTEILYTKVFAVFYHLSFMFIIVSLAMLGTGVAGTLIYVLPNAFSDKKRDSLLYWSAVLFCLSVPLSLRINILSAGIPYASGLRPSNAAFVLSFLSTMVPFALAGCYVTLNVRFFRKQIARFYFADLTGAAVGCVLSAALVSGFGAIRGLLVAPIPVACVAAVLAVRNRKPQLVAVATLTAVFLGFASYLGEGTPYFTLSHAKGRKLPQAVLHSKWSVVGKVTVNHRGIIRIDEGVITPIPRGYDSTSLETLRESALTTAYNIRAHGEALIIGPGGGIDILRATTAHSDTIVGVELNPAIVDAMKGPLRRFSNAIYLLPRVGVICGEGRNYVNQSDRTFDIIQISFIDTYTASATGSTTLSENTLYTVEAFQEYWRHLKESGILTISRWGGGRYGTSEIERATALAVHLLLTQGVKNPGEHIVAVRNAPAGRIPRGPGYMGFAHAEDMAVLLVKKTPFTALEIKTIVQGVEQYGQRPLYLPGCAAGLPSIVDFVGARNLDQLELATRKHYSQTYFDLTPPTDEKPFFFSMLKPNDFVSMQRKFPDWREIRPRAAKYSSIEMLWKLLQILLVLASTLILLPLFIRFRAIRTRTNSLVLMLYFASIGLGFMLVEISTVNRFSLLLGHPANSLTLVLSSILISAGLGSLISGALPLNRSWLPLTCVIFVGAASWMLQPLVVASFLHSSFGTRCIVCVLCVAPQFFPMGMILPVGVRLLRHDSDLIPWAFGLNGVFSVVASALAMIVNLQGGYGLTFMFGIIAYGVALSCLLAFSLGRGPTHAAI